MKRFTANGIVFGNCWGGGACGYKARTIQSNNFSKLVKEAKRQLKTGELDSGMGFESLYGACLDITIEDIKKINKKEYINTEHSELFIGKLTDNEIDTFYENY